MAWTQDSGIGIRSNSNTEGSVYLHQGHFIKIILVNSNIYI